MNSAYRAGNGRPDLPGTPSQAVGVQGTVKVLKIIE
jgi:hypothetical protein